MSKKSTFYSDGYRDAGTDRLPSPPNVSVYADEYWTGYWDGCLPPASTDQRTLAERKWQAPTKAAKPQQPCDHGLFSDEADQLDIIEMLQDPTND